MSYTQTNITGPAPRTSDGYSLIELMLVLALITLLMWVAVPRYGAQQAQGRSAAMRLKKWQRFGSPRNPLNKCP